MLMRSIEENFSFSPGEHLLLNAMEKGREADTPTPGLPMDRLRRVSFGDLGGETVSDENDI